MIQNKAMLATLCIQQWHARKTDKDVTQEVETKHGAHDSGRFSKALVSKDLLAPIAKFTSRLREWHYGMTLPWTDNGARLLPATMFLDYSTKVRQAKTDYANLVDAMVRAYPAEVQAARARLGTMYNPDDYPDPSDLSAEFKIGVEFTPVPTSSDFRVDLNNEAMDEIKQQITDSVHLRQEEAVKATFTRVREVVSKMDDRLSDPKAIFKDTLVSNVGDLCKVLDGLNITGDVRIDEIAKFMTDELIKPASALRTNLALRSSVAGKCKELLARLP